MLQSWRMEMGTLRRDYDGDAPKVIVKLHTSVSGESLSR
jgi:hypothetical protein